MGMINGGEVELRPLNSAKHWPLCWLASKVMLEAGLDCAKIGQLTIEVGMSMLFASVLQKTLFPMIPKPFKYLEGMMLKNERMVEPLQRDALM